MNIYIFWGVKGIDKSEVSKWNAKYIGKVIFDDEFSLYSIEA